MIGFRSNRLLHFGTMREKWQTVPTWQLRYGIIRPNDHFAMTDRIGPHRPIADQGDLNVRNSGSGN